MNHAMPTARIRAAMLATLAFALLAASSTPATRPAESKETSLIEHYDLREKNPYTDKLSVQPLDTRAGFKTISLAIPAAKELPEHTTPTPAVLFMLEGDAHFLTRSEDIHLRPGTVVHIPPDVPHRILATMNSHLVLVK